MIGRRINRDIRYQVTVPKSERERQIALYAELAAESERADRINAALQVDALLDRVRQYDASGCAECDDEPAPMSPWLFWPLVVACSLTLTFAACELAMRVLPWIWSHS